MATTFIWKGTTPKGESLSGELEAASKEEVASRLRKQRIKVKLIREKAQRRLLPSLRGKVKVKDMSIFTRQFSTMINAGLPIVQCLEILGSQQDNRTFQKILFQVRQDAGDPYISGNQVPSLIDNLINNDL